MPTITDKRGRRLSMARSGEMVVIDSEGRERAIHRVPYGTVLMFEHGSKVKEGERLAEWDPFTLPIITEQSGVVRYQDLAEGKTMEERVDEATGIAQRVVTEYRATGRSKKEDLRPRMTLLNETGDETEAARYMLAPGTTLSVEDGQHVEAGDILARASREAAKTRDITGGLPRVAELFEARMPKDNAIIAKISGRIEFVRDYKAKRKIAIIPEEGDPVEYLVPKTKVIDVQEGDFVKKGDTLISGSPNPHDILEVLGRRGAGRVPRGGDPGGLPAPGREDQRQAHRGDRSPDAAEGRDHRRRRHHAAAGRAARSRGDGRVQRQADQGPAAGGGHSGAARHHQGEPADAFVHLGRLVPGDHPRAHPGRGRREEGHADRAQGERDRRPPDPRRHRRGHEPAARHRHQPRRGDPRSWKQAQEHLIMANTAAEEHAAELEQGAEAAVFEDPLAGSRARPTAPTRMPASTSRKPTRTSATSDAEATKLEDVSDRRGEPTRASDDDAATRDAPEG
jgi:DNA-directed RNA polymerase subunit beta'